MPSAYNKNIALQTFHNTQQKELTSTQESNWADFMPIVSLENTSSIFKADLGLLDLIMDPKLEVKRAPF